MRQPPYRRRWRRMRKPESRATGWPSGFSSKAGPGFGKPPGLLVLAVIRAGEIDGCIIRRWLLAEVKLEALERIGRKGRRAEIRAGRDGLLAVPRLQLHGDAAAIGEIRAHVVRP